MRRPAHSLVGHTGFPHFRKMGILSLITTYHGFAEKSSKKTQVSIFCTKSSRDSPGACFSLAGGFLISFVDLCRDLTSRCAVEHIFGAIDGMYLFRIDGAAGIASVSEDDTLERVGLIAECQVECPGT